MTKRMRPRENARHLVFEVTEALEQSWRPLNSGTTIMTLLLGSARFVDGVYGPRREVSDVPSAHCMAQPT